MAPCRATLLNYEYNIFGREVIPLNTPSPIEPRTFALEGESALGESLGLLKNPPCLPPY